MKKEYAFLFILFSLLSLPNLINLCRAYTTLSYDYQIILTWNYAASIGLQPTRDIFFPYYGLVNYLRGENIFFGIIYFLVTPFLFTFLFFIFQKIFNNKIFSYTSIFVLFIFVYKITGFEMFSRYGVLLFFSCVSAYLFSIYKSDIPKKNVFFLGILNGLILLFFNDQSIYAAVVFIVLVLTDTLIKYGFARKLLPYKKLFFTILLFLSGFFIGLIPCLVYLSITQSIHPFFASLLELSDITYFAKIPFFHGAATANNLFTFAFLFSTIYLLSYKLIYRRSKQTLTTYLLLGVGVALLIVEQKNLVRSVDVGISFFGLLLFIFLFSELLPFLYRNKYSTPKIFIYYLNLSFIILFVLNLTPIDLLKSAKLCPANRFEIANKEYQQVKQEVTKMKGYNGTIFSFPGDTIFYVIFNQKTLPYYPTIFEAASTNAQQKMIDYIIEHKIPYIIFNSKDDAIQDTVPNYIRTPLLYRYIFNNYHIAKKINSFLILQKNRNNEDLFNSQNFKSEPELKKQLLKINLQYIPVTEGIYKRKNLNARGNKTLIKTNSLQKINNFLSSTSVKTEMLFLTTQFNNGNKKKNITITLTTKDNLKTSITFNQCEKETQCIIHLARVPLFYKNREIRKISIDNMDQIKNIQLIYNNNPSTLW